MKSNIRITLSERSSQELLDLMHQLNIDSPTHCVNTIITQLYKSRLSLSEEKSNDTSSTNNQ